jgi:hypothetical protein
MKVAIVTLPLHTNYGGLLQAFALKRCLTEMGHETSVLDLEEKMPGPKPLKAPFVYARRILGRMFKGSAAPEVFREKRFKEELPVVGANTDKFIRERIAPRVLRSFRQVREKEYDAFVVGSDQVWRPRYFPDVENAFLSFAKGWDVKRIAYAASFGTSELEYDSGKLQICSDLLSCFDAVSVREEAGVSMCSEWFAREDAVHVLDPVMLLDAQEYRDMASAVHERPAKGKLVTYILDASAHKRSVVDFISRAGGFDVHDVSVRPYDRDLPVEERVVPALEQWLAGFADADFVVTDSFHGCVLSILFHKRFIAVGNTGRGLARLQSLTEMFGLDQRLVHGIDPEDDGEYFLSEPDWASVEEILQKRREECLVFLKNNLK